MNEAHITEIERVMRRVSRARFLAEETVELLKRENAELHLIRTMEQAAKDLDEANSQILKGAHYGRPEDQGRLIA